MSERDERLVWAPAPGHDDDVRYAVDGPLGRVRLHRPQAINALTPPMVASLHEQLTRWAEDPSVRAVVVDGAGERGLCAGGDVRAVRQWVLEGRADLAEAFWHHEYAVNALIASFPRPVLAWMDGIVMGGGVGVSAHGSARLATERTALAMPETVIGLFPDVGALHLLSRAPGELGTYAALTGSTITGSDAVALGLADAVVPSMAKDAVLAVLREDPATGAAALAEVAGGDGSSPIDDWEISTHPTLLDHQAWIDECFAGDDPAVILRRLRAHPSPEAQEAATTLAARSPHSVAVTLEAIRRAASMTLEEVLAQDLVVATHLAVHPDFAEGVRAQLVDKDRSPRWTHSCLDEVSRAEVLAAFGES